MRPTPSSRICAVMTLAFSSDLPCPQTPAHRSKRAPKTEQVCPHARGQRELKGAAFTLSSHPADQLRERDIQRTLLNFATFLFSVSTISFRATISLSVNSKFLCTAAERWCKDASSCAPPRKPRMHSLDGRFPHPRWAESWPLGRPALRPSSAAAPKLHQMFRNPMRPPI
jgi:hypothetical protein